MARVKLNDLYTEPWFRLRPKMAWRTPIMCEAVWKTFGPFSTLVDLGCGIGEFVAYFMKHHKILAIGFDGAENCLTHMAEGAVIYIHDLREPLGWGKPKFQLCMCLEVAEHVEAQYADTLVQNCVDMSNTILFTAAPPNQGGLGHVNCQPPSYWVKKFADHGYQNLPEKESEFRSYLERDKTKKGIRAYYENVMVFQCKSQS